MKYSINYFGDDLRILNEEVASLKTKLPILSNPHRNVILWVKKLGTLLLALLILASFPFSNQVAEGKETEILLLHTNNVTGHLFPCPT
jgi:hypothetical protein